MEGIELFFSMKNLLRKHTNWIHFDFSAKLDGVKSMGKARIAAHESIEDWLETERGQGNYGATDRHGKRRVRFSNPNQLCFSGLFEIEKYTSGSLGWHWGEEGPGEDEGRWVRRGTELEQGHGSVPGKLSFNSHQNHPQPLRSTTTMKFVCQQPWLIEGFSA